uniref:Uncharacterized protein n=1 Tax=Trichuris muris TaxID=70415 RepID=A0A5S6QK38_TRIMR
MPCSSVCGTLAVSFFALAVADAVSSGGSVHHKVKNGDDATLQCEVRFDSDDTPVWKRYSGLDENAADILFVDQSSMSNDERFNVSQKRIDGDTLTTLHITKNHTVEVLESPSVQIVPDLVNQLVPVGGNISLVCSGAGVPKPRVFWKRKGKKFPNGRDVHVGSDLSVENASMEDVGTYQCFAENGVGPTAVASVNVILKYGPIVKTVNSFVPVAVGQAVAINCTYSANPGAQVRWSFNGYNIDFNQEKIRNRMKIVSSVEPVTRENVTILEIYNVIMEDFGNYTCQVFNPLGVDEQVILVSGKPGKPFGLTVRPDIRRPGQIDLSWTLVSVDSVTGYRLFLKSDDGQHSEVVQVPLEETSSVNVSNSHWKCSCKLNSLQPNKMYAIAVQARNDYGWGFTSSPIYLRTDDVIRHGQPEGTLGDSPGHGSALLFKQSMLAFILVSTAANFGLLW